ncbi:MAG: Gfo/Idh/MocA family oxidoreductase [Candidatus Bathyarchaeota archaeon]|nr:MAG: Gfo/Idh/MocA family oxidoreductase [Candidatus Bathyarchaeota archaeon]
MGVAVIGCGFWGRQHVRVFSSFEKVVLAAVADIDLNRARTVAKEYGVTKTFTDYSKILEDPSIGAVSICTPTTTHWKIAEEAVDSGKDVFVEKPICDTSEQARLLVAKAEREGVKIMPGHIERFNPGVRRIKNLLNEGALGEIVLLFAKRVGRWPDRIGDVGVIKDSAIHDLDLTRYLIDEEPVSIYAKAGSLGHRYEDFAEIIIGFPGVKTAFIESNWLTPRKIRRMIVTGKEAIAELDFLSQEVVLEDASGVTKMESTWVEPLMLEIKHFVDCLLGEADPIVTGFDGLKALEMAELALEASSTGEVVHL